MVTAAPRQAAADLVLLRALFARQAGAWARFVERCEVDIYSGCRLAFPDAEAADAFSDVIERLRADDFQLLRAFDGRASLSVYLRLVLRDLLSQRVARLLAEDPGRGWRAFEHFFKRDIDRLIAQNFPEAGPTGRTEDIYHDLVAALVEGNYRRILAYDGTGSFGGFVLRVTRNLCIDLRRKDVPRRRLPAPIKRLSETEQEVFRQLHWENCPPDQLGAALRAKSIVLDGAAVAAAIAAVKAALPRHAGDGEDGRMRQVTLKSSEDGRDPLDDFADERPTPEGYAIEREEQESLNSDLQALREAIPQLPSDVRLYLQHVVAADQETAPREIARLMGRPVTDIYRLRQQAERMLRQTLSVGATKKSGDVRLTPAGDL